MQKYLESLKDEGDIRVTVWRLDDGAKANFRGDEKSVAASTYKIYVVAFLLNKIRAGEISYGTGIKRHDDARMFESDDYSFG